MNMPGNISNMSGAECSITHFSSKGPNYISILIIAYFHFLGRETEVRNPDWGNQQRKNNSKTKMGTRILMLGRWGNLLGTQTDQQEIELKGKKEEEFIEG